MIWFLLGMVVLFFILLYNSLRREENQIKNAFATVDVILNKRYDLIPNLVSIAKAGAIHEQEVFENIANLRAQAIVNKDSDKAVKLDNAITEAFNSIFATLEGYPELTSGESFLNLQHTLTDLEDEISAARRAYNAAVTEYNISIQSFPTNVVAAIFSMKSREVFIIDEGKKSIFKVDF